MGSRVMIQISGPGQISFEEWRARIRQKNHRMGPDVPYWVQNVLDDAYYMLIGMRSGLWMGALFAAIVVAIYNLHAIGHELPLIGVWTCRDIILNVGIFAALVSPCGPGRRRFT